MNKLIKLAAASAILISMAACNNGENFDNETRTEQYFYNSYAVITDIQSGEQTVSTPVTTKLEINWTHATGVVTFSGLKFGGVTSSNLTLSSMDLKSDGDWSFSTTSAPVAQLASGTKTSVSNFTFKWNDRLDIPELEEYDPEYYFSFDYDNKYTVKGSRAPFNFWGTTTSQTEGQPAFVSEVNKIVAAPNFADMTMTVLINGAKFADRMPGLNIQLDNIPMQIVDGGASFTFSTDQLIPTIGGDPYPMYPCSNISGTLSPETGLTFRFDCDVPRMGLYTVTTSPTPFGYK